MRRSFKREEALKITWQILTVPFSLYYLSSHSQQVINAGLDTFYLGYCVLMYVNKHQAIDRIAFMSCCMPCISFFEAR